MTDLTPDPIGAIRARWSNYGGMGNSRSDEDYTDAGCRILARAAFRDFPVISAHVAALADEVRALRAENQRLTERLASANEALVIFIAAGNERAAERDSALAELAAARDQIAAVTNERNRLANIARQLMHGLTPKAEAERLIAAALSQSGQPTKGEPA